MQKILYGIIAFVALLILIGFALPRTHRIEVAAEIDASQATVFALVNDFRRFTTWAPWTDTDPNVRFIYSGARRGEGATVMLGAAVVLTALREDYGEVEAEAVREVLADTEMYGFDLSFYCMDLVIQARLRAFSCTPIWYYEMKFPIGSPGKMIWHWIYPQD